MSGAYRHVVICPTDVSWRCVRYTDPFADLIPSDLDELNNHKLTGILEGTTTTSLANLLQED